MNWLTTTAWFVQSPWMLLALLSLIVPVIIHLLSKSRGKLIPFGNIDLIKISKPVRMNEIRLVDYLLLLCRLLLLFLSVLILAQLYYDDRFKKAPENESNILVTKDWLNNASSVEINQLLAQVELGNVYLLSSPNKRLTTDEILQWKVIHTGSRELIQQNTWLLVNHYVKTLPDNINVTVYSTNRLSQFIGDKVHLPQKVSWHIKELSTNELTQMVDNVINTPIKILVISDHSFKQEAEYLHAALSIIQDSKLNNLSFEFKTLNSITTQENSNIQMLGLDWLLYLSDEPIPEYIKNTTNSGTKLITENNHVGNDNSTYAFSWKQQLAKVEFPQVLLSIFLDEFTNNYQLQQRLSKQQIISPLADDNKSISSTLISVKAFKNQHIEKLLILLLILLWSVERVLSEIKKQSITPVHQVNSSDVQKSERIT